MESEESKNLIKRLIKRKDEFLENLELGTTTYRQYVLPKIYVIEISFIIYFIYAVCVSSDFLYSN